MLGWFNKRRGPTDRELLIAISERVYVLELGVYRLMTTFAEAKQDLADTKALVAKVAADVAALHAKIDNFPAPGMTPEQQAALDEIGADAKALKDSLAVVDAATDDEPPVV